MCYVFVQSAGPVLPVTKHQQFLLSKSKILQSRTNKFQCVLFEYTVRDYTAWL